MIRSAGIVLVAFVSCGISGVANAHGPSDPPLAHRHQGEMRLHAHYSQQALPGQGSYPYASSYDAGYGGGGYGQYQAYSQHPSTYVSAPYTLPSYGYQAALPSGGACCTYTAPPPVSYSPAPCPVGWGGYSGHTGFW